MHIDRRTEGDAAHTNDSVHLFVADGSKATVVETILGHRRDASEQSCELSSPWERAPSWTHILLDLSPARATNFAVAEYHVAADAKIRTVTIHAGVAP